MCGDAQDMHLWGAKIVMCSDLQCLDHVRVAVVPACLSLVGGGVAGRSVMSL